MPVTFVIGRSGSGKTARTLDRVADDARANPLGRPIWLIVPKQATFEYERALVARLGAFARVRVVSTEGLGEGVLREVGGVAVPQVTPVGRQMIIGRLLYQYRDQLKYFASSARRPGMAAAIDGLFDDFERSGRSLDQVGDLVDQLAHAGEGDGRPADPAAAVGRSPSLHAKLADLRLLYERYRDFVGQDRLDPEQRRRQVLRQLTRSELLDQTTIFVDAFYEFSEAERQTLAVLAAGRSEVEVNLTLPPDGAVVKNPGNLPNDLSPFYRTEVAYRRLLQAMADAGASVRGTVTLKGPHRFGAEPLARIERHLFAATSPTEPASPAAAAALPDGASAVTFIEAADPRAEVQAVARQIADLLRRDGYRQRDVLVLARSLDPYLHLVHAAFGEHGLTYFADRRRPATHHPLVRLVRSAVRVARENWSPSAVMALAKTGLAGLSPPECDRLENYVRERGITAAGWLTEQAWGFAAPAAAFDEEFDVRPADAADEASVATEDAGGTRSPEELRRHVRDRLRPLVDRLVRNAPPAPLRDLAATLLNTIEGFGARRTLAGWIEADRDPEQAEEHEQVWKQLVGLIEQMVDVLGDQTVEPGEFVEILESGLDGFDLAITPPTLDQVLVGTADRTRTLSAKAVFVLGLSRGQFPHAHRDDSLLSAPERRELHKHRVDVDPDPGRRQLDERFLAYVALTRGSHKLYLSRACADEAGREQDRSEYWTELLKLVPEAPVVKVAARGQRGPEGLATPRDVVASLLGWARGELGGAVGRGDRGGETDAVRAGDWHLGLYDWIARRPRSTPRTLSAEPRPSGSGGVGRVGSREPARPTLPLPDGGGSLRTGPGTGDGADTPPTELDRLVGLAWPALGYGNDARLSAGVAAKLFPSPLTVTAAQLEAFAACPFQHFVAYGLGLATRGSGDISGLDLSRVYHEVLETIVAGLLESDRRLADVPAEELSALAERWAPAIALKLRGERLLEEARSQYLVARVARTLDMILGTLREQLGRGVWRPMKVGVPFGPKAPKLKSPDIACGDGKTVRLRGRIDRVDVAPDGGLAAYDYRMGDQRLAPASVYHGLSLRLLTCVLVLDHAGGKLNGKPLVPAAALCARLLRSLQREEHPEDCLDPASPDFLLSTKPRGVVRESHFEAFDPNAEAGAWSKVLSAYRTKDGGFGMKNTTDVAADDEFRTLVKYVERKVAELAGQIAHGNVGVEPYLYQDVSPCPRCDFRSVCRFEPGVNRYRKLESLKRDDALAAMRQALDKANPGTGDTNGR